MKRTVQSAVLAGMMAFGLAACNTPSNTDSMSGSSAMGTAGSSQADAAMNNGQSGQVPEAGKGQSWTAGATGATGVNGASGTVSNDGDASSGDRR